MRTRKVFNSKIIASQYSRGNIISNREEIVHRWTEHFEDLLNQQQQGRRHYKMQSSNSLKVGYIYNVVSYSYSRITAAKRLTDFIRPLKLVDQKEMMKAD